MRTWANLPAGLRSPSLVPAARHNGSVHHCTSSPCDRVTPYNSSTGSLLRTPARGTPHARAIQRRGLNEPRPSHLQHRRGFSNTPTSRIRLDEDEDEDHELPANTRAPARPIPTRMPARPVPVKPVSSATVSPSPSPAKTVPSRPVRRQPPPSSPTMDMRSLIRSRELKERQAKKVDDAQVSMDFLAERIRQTENDIQLIPLAREVRDIQSQFQQLDLVDLAAQVRDIEVKLQTLLLQRKVHDIEASLRSLPEPSSILEDIAASRFLDAEIYLDEITSDISRTSRNVRHISDAYVKRLQNLVYSSGIQCKSLELLFCKIVYHQTPYFTKRVAVSQSKLMSLQTNFITIRLETLREHISSIQRVVREDYLEPRASAREKIDGLLDEMNTTAQQYKEIQERSQAINEGAYAVMACLYPLKHLDLRVVNERGLGFEDFLLLLDESRKQLGWLAHTFRSVWLERKNSQASFKDSSFWSTKDFTEVRRSSKGAEMSSLQVVKCRMFAQVLGRDRKMKHFSLHRQVIANYLHDLYAGRLAGKDMTTSQLTLAWRQLDNNAPFEISLNLDWWLHEEMLVMIRALDGSNGPLGPMFAQFDPNVVGAVKGDLKKLTARFAEFRKAFNVEFHEYKVINWYRLKIEEKLLELDEPSLIQQQRLFVPAKPLSRNKERFEHWVQLISSITFKAWVLRKINNLPHVTIVNASGEETTPYGRMCSLYLSFLQSSVPEIGSVMTDGPKILKTRTIKRKRLLLPLFRRKFGETACLPDKAMPLPTTASTSSEDHPTQSVLESTSSIVPTAPIAPIVPSGESNLPKPPTTPIKTQAESSKPSQKSKRRARQSRLASKQGREDSAQKSADSSPQSLKPAPAASQEAPSQSKRPEPMARRGPSKPRRRKRSRPSSDPSAFLSIINKSDTECMDEKAADSIPQSPEPALATEQTSPSRVQRRSESKAGFDPSKSEARQRRLDRFLYKIQAKVDKANKANKANKVEPKPVDDKHADSIHQSSEPPLPLTTKRTLPWLNQRAEPSSRYDPCRPGPRRRFGTSSKAFTRINHADPNSIAEHRLPLENASAAVINSASLRTQSAFKATTADLYWTHNAQRTPSGQKPIVHYCRSLESTEQVAQLFLDSKVIGFDMEWKANASSTDSIQNNVSLIQIASEERIALFQIALFKPAKTQLDFIAPSLRKILESPHITKVGVCIKGDTTRLRKFLGIDTRSIFELSHLHRLVKYGLTNPELVNKRVVNLSDQVEEHLGLPLEKGADVRCSDWTRALTYHQVQYAATDPYACICLFNSLDKKRQAMNPMPPLPAHADLNRKIILPKGEAVVAADEESVIPDAPDR